MMKEPLVPSLDAGTPSEELSQANNEVTESLHYRAQSQRCSSAH